MGTAEEAKAEYIAKMGQELGEQYSELWQEVAYLHMKWREYTELLKTESRTKLLNQAAPAFFWIVQREMWENILIHLARLTDPSKSAGKHNLTLQNLPTLVSNAELKDKLETLISRAIKETAFCRDWRNRRIAHKDLHLVMERAEPLQAASKSGVDQALDRLAQILNAIAMSHLDSETHFTFDSIGGAEQLFYVLDEGLKAEAERRARLSRGEYREEDYKPRNL